MKYMSLNIGRLLNMNKLRHNNKVIDHLLKQAKIIAMTELEPRDEPSQYFYLGFVKAYIQILDTLKGYKP